MSHVSVKIFVWTALLLTLSLACGVKGPPLPPLPVTPQQSDIQRKAPVTSPTPTPSPSTRSSRQLETGQDEKGTSQ